MWYLCFLIKNFFTVMICMLNKSCPDSADGLYSKKKNTNDNNKGQLSVIIRY